MTSARTRIPKPAVLRLSLYLRDLDARGSSVRWISSRAIADALGLTDAQVRKDLNTLGLSGQSGVGYRTDALREALRAVLGTDRPWRTAVVGVGNIGRAVMSYERLQAKGFGLVAVFDRNPALIGSEVAGCIVEDARRIAAVCRAQAVDVALLAVPAAAAQDVADQLVLGGIRGILNFAPVRLSLPPHVAIVSVDLTVSLEQLAFRMSLLAEMKQDAAAGG